MFVNFFSPPLRHGKIRSHLAGYISLRIEYYDCVICGDFDYWVDNPSSKPFSAEFVELLDLSNFENFVSFPTHLSGHTLYLILVPAGSEYVKHVEALPIDSDMSDHALILFSLEVMRPHAVKKTYHFPQLPQCRQ